MTRLRRIVFIGLAAALVGLLSTLHVNLRGSEPSEKPTGISEIRGQNVSQQYQTWAGYQDAAGGDANLMVSLGRARNHTVEARQGAGSARLDMKTGRITAQVSGLDASKEYELWLVASVSGAADNTLRDPSDRSVSAGTFKHDGKTSTLAGQVDARLFDHFQVDTLVVAHKGEPPSTGGVLFGSLSLFQRVYAALGNPSRLMASDFASSARRTRTGDDGPILSVRSAYASHEDNQNVFIDADVLFSNLVKQGSDLFFNENFDGNGRTCGTCHPALHNLTIDVPFIASLPDDNPLFVAEFVPALAQNFETPALMRGAALIRENLDGFGDVAHNFVMRSVPHLRGISLSLNPTNIPFDDTTPPNSNFPPGFPAARTGWGGDGAPNSGSLRDFATGAVNQHFPLTQARVAGKDFRLPTSGELDALEAFQRAMGRQAELDIASIKFRDRRVKLGRDLFSRLDTGNPAKPTMSVAPNPAPQGPPLPAGKCALCHSNAGANLNTQAFVQVFASIGQSVPTVTGNPVFATGVNDLGALPANIIDAAHNPRDGGFGLVPHDGVTKLPQIGNVPCAGAKGGFGVVTLPGGFLPAGLCGEDFNVPSIVEAADSPPFFHNNAVNTIESAVAFYNDDALNNSAGGQLLKALDTNHIGIKLDTTQVTAIASFLRVLNALENIRQTNETLNGVVRGIGKIGGADLGTLLDNAQATTGNAIDVLKDGQLHPVAVRALQAAFIILGQPTRATQVNAITILLNRAKADLVDP